MRAKLGNLSLIHFVGFVTWSILRLVKSNNPLENSKLPHKHLAWNGKIAFS